MDIVLAVDIGNTMTKIGVIDIRNMTCKKKNTVHSPDNHTIVATINALVHQYPETNTHPIRISSTIKSKIKDIKTILYSGKKKCRFVPVKYHRKLPFTSNYVHPENLGPDRIAHCLFCINKFPGRDCIVICAGTATTIDIVSKKRKHLGGYILPGIHTQFSSLYSNASALPLVTAEDNRHSRIFPPDSTESGIYNGVVLEQSGGVSFIINRVTEAIPGDYTILVCGGEWNIIRPHVTFSALDFPDLTLIGTGLFTEI